MKAYEVTVKYWNPAHIGIYPAATPAQARYKAWKAAHEAGFDKMKFDMLSVRRAPEFDCIVDRLKHGVDRTWARILLEEHRKEKACT